MPMSLALSVCLGENSRCWAGEATSRTGDEPPVCSLPAYVSIRQHTSAYVSIRPTNMCTSSPIIRGERSSSAHSTIYVYMCPQTTIYVSSYYYMCPNTTTKNVYLLTNHSRREVLKSSCLRTHIYTYSSMTHIP